MWKIVGWAFVDMKIAPILTPNDAFRRTRAINVLDGFPHVNDGGTVESVKAYQQQCDVDAVPKKRRCGCPECQLLNQH
jgi:hypothetical protein